MDEGLEFFNRLITIGNKCGAKAQILYDIDYEHPVQEQVLDHLRGYRDSQPVRIGNGAYSQLQLDVFGEVLEAAHSYLDRGDPYHFVHSKLMCWVAVDRGIKIAGKWGTGKI